MSTATIAKRSLRLQAAEELQGEASLSKGFVLGDSACLQAILDAIDDGMAVLDEEHRIIMANRRLRQMTGYYGDETGANLLPLDLFARSGENSKLKRWQARAEGDRRQFDASLVKKNGSRLEVTIRPEPLFDSAGHFRGSVTVFVDRSELTNLRSEIIRATSLLSQILDTVTTGIRVLDRDGRIVTANRAFAVLSGQSMGEIIGGSCRGNFPGEMCDTDRCPLKAIVRYGTEPLIYEVSKTRSDGSTVICRLTATPFRNEENEVIGVAEEFVDLTQEKEAQSTLARKNEILREMTDQIRTENRRVGLQIQTQVDRVIRPLVSRLRAGAGDNDRKRLDLLNCVLDDIVDPFVNRLEKQFASLSPRETEICHHIRNGLASKEIASLLCVSVGTVEQQRKRIRKKLGINGHSDNLTTVLRRLTDD